MTTQTKGINIPMYDLTEMLSLYENTVQGVFRIHGTRKDALRLARQAIQQKYPQIKNTNLGSNILIARFWKQTQTIIRKYYPHTVLSAGPSATTVLSVVPNASIVPNAIGGGDAVVLDPRCTQRRGEGFEDILISWINQNDFVPTYTCLMVFTGLDRSVILKAFDSAQKQGYEFQRISNGFQVTTRPEPINNQVAEIKTQLATLMSRLEKLTGNSSLFQ